MLPFVYTIYRFYTGFRAALRDPEYTVLITLAFIILGAGTLFYHDMEGWGWIDSLYFSVVTLATVGYGDFAPHTPVGKIFTIVYIFIGLGVFVGFINAVMTHTVRESKEKGVLFPKNINLPFMGKKREEETTEQV